MTAELKVSYDAYGACFQTCNNSVGAALSARACFGCMCLQRSDASVTDQYHVNAYMRLYDLCSNVNTGMALCRIHTLYTFQGPPSVAIVSQGHTLKLALCYAVGYSYQGLLWTWLKHTADLR